VLRRFLATQKPGRPDAEANRDRDGNVPPKTVVVPNRRRFLKKVGGAAAGMWAAQTLAISSATGAELAHAEEQEPERSKRAFLLRGNAALQDRNAGYPSHPTNGDELRYGNRIGNYSKGLPHNSIGEVNPAAYSSLLQAVNSGAAQDFEAIIVGGSTPLVDPQAGLAFDMEGLDSHQFVQGPPPALASAQRAGEAVEDYWMALLRDVNFTQYGTDPTALAAAAELSGLTHFRGPRENGRVSPRTLFRGFTPGDVIGPYVSQFLLQPITYGAIPIEQRINTYLSLSSGGSDYLTDTGSWLAIQNGAPPLQQQRTDPTPRHIRNGRDLAAYVHIDALYEAYLNACIWLIDNHAPFNPGNPYNSSRNQTGFGTFGSPHVKALLAEVSTRALKAVWFQKWFVHRCLRPEEFGGLVHFTKTHQAAYPLHPDVLNSQAVAQVFARNGSYLMPHAFPEGCPLHPSYGQGHGTVAGACSTIVKAFFDDSWVIPNPVVASEDGLSLVPYTGSDADQITVGGEINKVAANIALGRDHAAVHWRSDYQDSLILGEAVAISILRDQRACYNETFQGLTFTKFDGTVVRV